MHLLCPHCKNPIELLKLDPRAEIACPSCGSSFRIDEGSTTNWIDHSAKTIGRFSIIETVGHGGFGTVFKAHDPELDRTVAVKVPRRGNVGEAPQDVDRFLREARSVAQLRHPSIVSVHEVGTMDGTPYLVSDFVEGLTLSDVLTARRPAPRETAKLIAEVADALHHAHQQGVVHRDVKPSNIMVRPDGSPVVMDFGLAKRDAGEITMTMDGQVLGTPAYMSPEQARGEGHRVDGRSDIYSLGVILYLLLTGEMPFHGNTRMLLHQVLHDEPKPPRSLNDKLPRDLETITLKAMAKEPAKRYATAEELASDLRRFLSGEAIVARPVGSIERAVKWVRRNPVVTGATAAVVLTLALGTTVSYLKYRDAEAARLSEAERVKERDVSYADKKAAEWEKERIALTQQYEHAIFESQRGVLEKPPRAGWPKLVLDKLSECRQLRPEVDVGDFAAITLAGIDITQTYRHEVTYPPKEHPGLSNVAFSPDGKKVLGAPFWQPGFPTAPALLWDGNSANKPTPSSRPGRGPVAFPDDASPLQLMVPNGLPQTTFGAIILCLPLPIRQVLPAMLQRPLTLWNVGTDSKVVDIPLPGPGAIISSALSPDARFAAVGFVPYSVAKQVYMDAVTVLWEIDRKAGTGSVKKVREWPGGPTAIAFSSKGELLATGSDNGEVVVRSIADEAEFRLPESDMSTTALGFGRLYRRSNGEKPAKAGFADGWLLAVGSFGGGLSVWDLRTRSRLNSFYGSEHAVYGVAFSPDGTILASSGRFFPFLWDVGTGRPLLRVQHMDGSINDWMQGVAFSPDGRRIAYGSGAVNSNGGLDVFGLDDDRGIRTFRGLTGVVQKVWLSHSGKHIAALSQNWQLLVAEKDTGRVKFIWDVREGWTADSSSVAFIENDTSVLLSSGRQVTCWSMTTGERTDSWKIPRGLNDCLLVPPERRPILLRRDLDATSQAVIARELLPNGQLKELYRINAADIDVRTLENMNHSSDGRFVVINVVIKEGGLRSFLYDGLTGKRISLDAVGDLAKCSAGWVSNTGTLLFLNEPTDPVRCHLFRLPDLKPLGTADRGFTNTDDAGKLGVVDGPNAGNGVALYRFGEDRPLVTFDYGFAPVATGYGLSPDGNYVYWGRRDGTVCIADVKRCVEQLAPFAGRK